MTVAQSTETQLEAIQIQGGDVTLSGARSRKVRSILMVVAHPDDEVIGAGARLHLFPGLTILHVTDGAPRNMADANLHGFASAADYAAARREELRHALQTGGADHVRLAELHIPDQQASFGMGELARAIALELDELRPDLVLTHPYEGGHPDHDATAFAVHAAVQLVYDPPPVAEFACYHARSGNVETGCFLPCADIPVTELTLSPAERRVKANMLSCFATQQQTLRMFATEAERFRPAPCYDFTQPPHEGELFYERFPWGMTGARFRELARWTCVELGIEGSAF